MLRPLSVFAILVLSASGAAACPDIPTFSTRVERASLPIRPPSPINGGEIETYRQDWETARVVKIEGFNKRRNIFAGRLQQIEEDLTKSVDNGECTPAEASKAKADIREGRRMLGEDMQLEYEELLIYYKDEQKWCALMIDLWKKCRAAGGCENGYPYVI